MLGWMCSNGLLLILNIQIKIDGFFDFCFQTVAYDGKCFCACPKIRSPVCGVDGQTYANGCSAKCAKMVCK